MPMNYKVGVSKEFAFVTLWVVYKIAEYELCMEVFYTVSTYVQY